MGFWMHFLLMDASKGDCFDSTAYVAWKNWETVVCIESAGLRAGYLFPAVFSLRKRVLVWDRLFEKLLS